jgi:hypothetical protein
MALVTDNGEMNFGPLDGAIPAPGRTALFALLAAGMLLPLLAARADGHKADRGTLALWGAALAMIAVLSFTRPAQRYLLFVLPFLVLTLPQRFLAHRVLFPATLALFCAANAFVEYSRWCTGTAAAAMADEVTRRGLVASTEPGAILPHAGSIFYRQPRAPQDHAVVAGRHPDAIVTTQAGIAPLSKSYSLIRQPGASAPTGH